MTLHRQLVVLVSMVLLTLLAGVFWLSIHNSRDLLERQLHVHAQDTANSLGLSVTVPLAKGDKALLDSMVGAIFQSGYYSEITLRDAQGKIVAVQREHKPRNVAPMWFIHALSIDPTPGLSEISHEWKVIGKLSVLPDAQIAYTELWRSAQHALWLFLGVGAAGLLLLWLILDIALRPLRLIERQAEAICQRDFSSQLPMPRARELQRVMIAMNRMTRQLKSLFDGQVAQIEQVRNQAFIDPVTGLGNGRFFSAQLQSRLESPEEPFVGALAKFELQGMREYNQRYGHEAGNWLLKQAGKLWRQEIEKVENAVVARVVGARFAALLPYVDKTQAQERTAAFLKVLSQLDTFVQSQVGLRGCVGVALCQVGRSLLEESTGVLEAEADAALKRAILAPAGAESVQLFDPSGGAVNLIERPPGVEDWESFLRATIERRELTFHYQPVLACEDRSLLHYEVLSRIKLGEQVLAAGMFMPLMERYHLVQSLDRMVVSTVLEKLTLLAPDQRVGVAVNLSSHSIREPGFVEWLLGCVGQHVAVVPHLIFEVPEVSVRTAHGRLKTLAEGLKRMGGRLTIDHFGSTNSSFGYLSGLPLYSIKIDQSYIRDIAENLDNQFFVQSLVRIAHSRQIFLTAETVETQSQWDLLRRFQLDGAQGYFLGKPAEINLLSA
ncbi:Conserved hypothetical protein [gamma proteobacterium HdN1]|nr:Conserved hypothetical protein [gamma proteobacterium HdN1]